MKGERATDSRDNERVSLEEMEEISEYLYLDSRWYDGFVRGEEE